MRHNTITGYFQKDITVFTAFTCWNMWQYHCLMSLTTSLMAKCANFSIMEQC